MSRYDIAIIGMGCIFPAADTISQYWKNILDGDSYFEPMPKHLWDMDRFYTEGRSKRETTYTTVGAFIDPDIDFPFLEYRLPPKTLEGMDPAQLVTLAATRAALEDAGIDPRSPQLEQGVTIIGASGVDGFAHTTAYLRRHRYFAELRPKLLEAGVSEAVIEALEAELGPSMVERGHGWNPGTAAVGNVPSSISNRVAQVFGVHGYNMTVDGACASSFAAIDVACQALCAGDARVVITGGCDLGTNPGIYVGFAQMDGLSPTGMACPFDHTANGLVIGEGAGIVVLKRLEDAVADGDRIRAVIRGIGTSSDGAGQAIYAPSVTGRRRSFEAALSRARTQPSEVQFLEAHATSTIVGDAVEYDAINETYGDDPQRLEPLRLGSVKHQIGHLKAAAGVAGLIKTVLAMEHATYPHMPRFEKLTPEASAPSDTLLVPTTTAPWQPGPGGMRVAAVTASGFGGVNYHVILEQGERYAPPAVRPSPTRDVAVVAVSCRVPGAETVDDFWANVTAGRDVFTPVTGPDVGWHDHLDVGPANERITTRVAGLLAPYDFNFLRHRIFPKSVSQISPTQFLALDLGERLLDQAGFELREPKNISVSVGTMHDDHYPTLCCPLFAEEYAAAVRGCPSAAQVPTELLEGAFAAAGPAFEALDPPFTEHTLPGWMTNVTAGRMANKLNLHGANMTVDSACSSGLAALVPAVYQLMFGDVDAVITGGLNRQLSAEFTAGVCTLGAVAEDTPRPFDARGKGFLIGEGGVFYLLKRLADAERDGDEVIAVLRAVHGSSEAESRSMVAPSESAVRRSIRNTLERTPVPGAAIGVVDVHGSANPVSDIVEARSLAAELRDDEPAGPPVWITAIKSHVGHLYGGSGASSMLSTLQAMRTATVPGVRNLENLRPELEATAHRAAPRGDTGPLELHQHGAINSLGLGGANYFAVLSLPDALEATEIEDPQASRPEPQTPGLVSAEATPATSPDPMRPTSNDHLDEVFLRGADGRTALSAALRRALQEPEPDWLDLDAWEQPTRLAVAAEDDDTLRARLKAADTMLERGLELTPLESQGVFAAQREPGAERPGLAFCFPGQGVHYIGMGRHLYDTDRDVRAVFDRVDAMARAAFGFGLLEHIFGTPGDAGIERELGTLVGAQTALFAMEVAIGRWLLSRGVQPDVLIGHSFGEICALTVAGTWDLEVGYQVVTERIHASEIATSAGGPPTAMMSLICTELQRDALLALAGDQVLLTNVNAPGRYVLAGVRQAIERTVEGARAFGAEAQLLPIGGAFHSPWMEPARAPFTKALAALPCEPPSLRILSTITGSFIEPERVDAAFLAEHFGKQLITPIDLPRDIERLYADGVRHFLEVGPRWAMTKMVAGILGERPHRTRFCLHPKIGDRESFRRARAFLAATGHLQGAPAASLAELLEPAFLDFLSQAAPAMIQSLREVHTRWLEHVTEAPVVDPEVLEAPEPTELPAAEVAPVVAAAVDEPAPAPVVEEPLPAVAAPAGASAAVWTQRLTDKLVEATGYPADMLEPQLDLEADLGIDSVQRAEIWASLLTEHGMDPGLRPTGPRTIENLASILANQGGDDPEPEPEVVPVPEPTPARIEAPVEQDEPAPEPTPEPEPFPVAEDQDPNANILLAPGIVRLEREDDRPFPCKRVLAITADLGASPVVDRLRSAGIEVMALHAAAVAGMNAAELNLALAEQDTIVYLAHRELVSMDRDGAGLSKALDQQVATIYGVFRALAPVLASSPLRVMVPVSQDGCFGASSRGPASLLGAFPAGFVRSLQRELPDSTFQLIDTGEQSWADAIEQRIDRQSPGLELGMGPYGPVLPTSVPLGQVVRRGDLLRPGDLLLVTGGARGIVYECVRALAGLTGARLLLTGRTPLPEDRPSWLEVGPEAIDQTLRELEIERVRSRGMGLGAARRATAKARAQWEVHRNLSELDAAGIDARYEVCDVSDRRSLRGLIARTNQRETIRGVVHGAGVQKGRLIGDLPTTEASRTITTKLEPLFTMLDTIDFSELRLLVGFGSVAGLFGNAGQTDYALANDLLAGAILALGRRWPTLQAQTVDWTAWTGTGMVTPEEEKRFAEAGLVPLDPLRGVRLFLDAVLGAAQPHLAAFNVTAAFADSREIERHPLTPRPSVKLVDPRRSGPTTVRFSRARDLWLDQHKVNGEPVVPGTFVTELLAQQAAVSGRGVRGVRFRRPMAVRDRSLAVELLEVDDRLLALPKDRKDLPAKALHNLAYASCELGAVETDVPRHLEFGARELLALHGASQDAKNPFYAMLDERFSMALDTGPIFRGILATRRAGERFLALVRLTDEAVAALAAPGSFLAHPVLADMAVQVGAAWAMIEHDVMAIPWEIGSLRVFGESQEREALVICQASQLGPKTSVMDVMVREPDGRPIFALMGLTLEAIAQGSDDPEADTAQLPDEIDLPADKKKS